MRVTNKQVLMLLQIAQDSLSLKDCSGLRIFTFDTESRLNLVNTIYNQQSDEIIDLDKNNNKKID
jgi:hypothetical protein